MRKIELEQFESEWIQVGGKKREERGDTGEYQKLNEERCQYQNMVNSIYP